MNKKERIELLCQLYAEVTSMSIINVGIVCAFKGWTFGASHNHMSDLLGAGVLSRSAHDNDEWLVIVPDYATAKQKITDYIDGRDDPNDSSTWERRFLTYDVSNRDEKPKMTVDMDKYPAFGENVTGPDLCTPELRWVQKNVTMNTVQSELATILQQKWMKADGAVEWRDVPTWKDGE